ncbi:MAG TPA: hypothetical protein VMV31_11145 [Terriglobales bacterium]|nr:hypothetical protein [Terriglobales bacterium]
MVHAEQSRLALAGLDGGDLASDSHPYLHLAQARARRGRTARLTPGGLPQPPELMGVDADARVPNQLQPMDGEFEGGREVGDGRPAFFGRDMPAPTGIANGVGVGTVAARPIFGAPTGMPVQPVGSDRFGSVDLSGVPGTAGTAPAGVAALPHFAGGGVLPAGGAGVVGEDGEEAISALPGGGVAVSPLVDTDPGFSRPPRAGDIDPGTTAAVAAATPRASALGAAPAPKPQGQWTAPAPPDLSGLPQQDQLSPVTQRMLGGYGVTAPPPGTHTAEQDYRQRADAINAAQAPQRGDYNTPLWEKLAGIGAGALAAGLTRSPQEGAAVAAQWSPAAHYDRAEQDYQQQRQQELAGLGPLEQTAKLKQDDNSGETRVWEQQTAAAGRQQQADEQASFRDLQQRDRESEDAAGGRYEQGLAQARQELADTQAAREGSPELMQTAAGDWVSWYPQSGRVVAAPPALRGARRGNLPQAPPPNQAQQGRRATAQAEIEMGRAPTRAAAQGNLVRNAAALEAAGVDGGALQQYLDRRWPQAKPGGLGLNLGTGTGAGATPAAAGGTTIRGVHFPG